jgi:heme/copper-type cytochrome/quinol oxidase subunit 1
MTNYLLHATFFVVGAFSIVAQLLAAFVEKGLILEWYPKTPEQH